LIEDQEESLKQANENTEATVLKEKKRPPKHAIERMERMLSEANKQGLTLDELADKTYKEMFE